MKVLLLILLVVAAQAQTYKNYTRIVTYVDSLISQWGSANCAAAIGVPGYAQYPTAYNVINLAFGVSYGYAGNECRPS